MKTIFILEDEDSIRELLEVLFNMEGYKIISSSSIREFNKMNIGSNVDLYLLDIRLPDGSGIAVCNDLKNNAETSKIPVLMMSAHAKTLELQDCCQYDEFISKPFDLDTMVATVSGLIGKM
ncbi:response regulator [Chryseobacterium sp. SSA4.19]|uniref:response regulator transcription factor n=1 Tax=Chryseobacterium sp. SSA4.19 TaxID=2919915 RepID=UPI001F4E5D79|nr:response regulator [Chryseobacterium sp. SSA4.19]MCJ8154175.1 response regulator [Chryseobacterium sp. SSA4.19]